MGGEKTSARSLKNPENVLCGIGEGVSGAGKEIYSGLTGIFTKPLRGAQEGGAKGFLKGVGAGVLGAVTSPFTAVLRATTSISRGIQNTASSLGGGMRLNGRMRYPRYITSKQIVGVYAEDAAMAKLILNNVKGGLYADQWYCFIYYIYNYILLCYSLEYYSLMEVTQRQEPVFIMITNLMIFSLQGITNPKVRLKVHRGHIKDIQV